MATFYSQYFYENDSNGDVRIGDRALQVDSALQYVQYSFELSSSKELLWCCEKLWYCMSFSLNLYLNGKATQVQ